MGKVTILEETCKNPLELMGRCAGIAYNSDTSDYEKNVRRGLQCVRDQHGRMLEFCDVFMELKGYSTRVIREFMRHVSDGLTVIQRSTRYVNEKGFEYYIPPKIAADETAKAIYDKIMQDIQIGYEQLKQLGFKNEDVGNVLPLGIHTVLAVKKNARCLSDMSRVRLCNRALLEYRELMRDIIQALRDYSEEWNQLANEIFACKCDVSGYCTEKMTCGRKPKKEDTILITKEEYEKLKYNLT